MPTVGLETWSSGLFIPTAVGTPATIKLANGNVIVIWAANNIPGLRYAIYDPLATLVSTGAINANAGGPQFLYGLIPESNGGFTLLFNQGGDLALQHFNSGLQPIAPATLVADDFLYLTNLPASLTALLGGGYAVAYTNETSADYNNIGLRIVAADGSVGNLINVNSTTAGGQFNARVETNGQNLFIAWQDGNTGDVRGQMLTLTGIKIGGEFFVPSDLTGSAGQPQIGVFPNGNYIVSWAQYDVPGSNPTVRARLFDANGIPLAEEFLLTPGIGQGQGAPDVTIMPDGSFFAVWFSHGGGSGMRWFNGDGTPRTDTFNSLSIPAGQSSLVAFDDGRIAVFGIDSHLNGAIIDARLGNYDGNDADNLLVARGTGPTTINGFAGNDRFYGNNDSDTFYGGAGNDEFRAQLGNDRLYGGPGDDIYYFTAFSNFAPNLTQVFEIEGEGTDTVYTNGFIALPTNVENGVLYADGGTSSLNGNGLANLLTGNRFNNSLAGLAGDDVLLGEAGDDTLNGGPGIDTMNGGAGNDIISVDNDGDIVVGGDGIDTVRLSATVTHTAAADVERFENVGVGDVFATLNELANTYVGGAGADLVYGGDGGDTIGGAGGIDGLFGQAGNDVIDGGDGQDKLDGGADNDTLSGGAEGDSMRGGEGDDVLDGGAGSDAMNGGTGVDIFTGSEGRDKFRFGDGDTGNTMATADRITDLDQAQGERISLTLMDAIVGGADDAFTFIGTAAFGNVAGELRYELIGGNTYVMGDTDGDGTSDFMIRLDGALVLTGADFSL